MSGTAPTAQRLLVKLTPAHLVRVGAGLDAVRVQSRGFGVLLGPFGLCWVWGSLDTVIFRRFRAGRCRALFVGLSGVGWASVALAPESLTSVPAVRELEPPPLPTLLPLPSLEVHLSLHPPEPP